MEKPFKLTLRVVWWMQIFQILFALLFTASSIFFLRIIFKGSLISVFVFLLFAFFAYLGWANALSTIQITNENVTVTVFYGRFRINWSEVQKVIRQGPLIALTGNEKRVVLAMQYMDKNKNKMVEYFSKQIEERKIEFTTNEQVPLTHQNAKV